MLRAQQTTDARTFCASERGESCDKRALRAGLYKLVRVQLDSARDVCHAKS